MDANLNFLTPPASKPTSVGASKGSTGLDPSLAKPMNGQEFAGVMRDLMAQGDRQDVAGTTTGEATDANAAALQTLNLGNQFSVITAASTKLMALVWLNQRFFSRLLPITTPCGGAAPSCQVCKMCSSLC